MYARTGTRTRTHTGSQLSPLCGQWSSHAHVYVYVHVHIHVYVHCTVGMLNMAAIEIGYYDFSGLQVLRTHVQLYMWPEV